MSFEKMLAARLARTSPALKAGYELVGYETFNDGESANLIVAMAPGQEVDQDHLQQWIVDRTRGGVIPLTAEILVDAEGKKVKLPVERSRETKSWSSRTAMTEVIAGTIYNSGDGLWERYESEGRVWLARKDDVHIQATLERVFNEQREAGYRGVALPLHACWQGGAVIANVGDLVRYRTVTGVYNGMVERKLDSGNLVVKSEVSGEIHEVDPKAIHNVVDKGDGSQAEKGSFLENYFTRAYGSSDYAKKLTRGVGAGRFAMVADRDIFCATRSAGAVVPHKVTLNSQNAEAKENIAQQLRLSRVEGDEYVVCMPMDKAAVCYELLGEWASESRSHFTMAPADREDYTGNRQAMAVIKVWDKFYANQKG